MSLIDVTQETEDKIREVSRLIMMIQGSWLGVARILDDAELQYNELIFTEKCRNVAEIIVFRYFHPVESPVGYSTRNTELVQIELGLRGSEGNKEAEKSAQDKIRRITRMLEEAMLIVRLELNGVKGICFQPSRFLIRHYEENIVNGVLGEIL